MEHDTTVHGLLPPNPSMPQVMRNCLKDRHARIQGVRRQVTGKDPHNQICHVSQSVSIFETQPAGVQFFSTPNGLI